MAFEIAQVRVGSGLLGICPVPGASGEYAFDFNEIVEWSPRHVISMTEEAELARAGAGRFGAQLEALGIGFHSLPIRDFGAPGPQVLAAWPEVSDMARATLDAGQNVLVHCRGGCGRSGMVLLRLMVELGESPEAALARLRAVRPCAVETDEQMAWAFAGALGDSEG